MTGITAITAPAICMGYWVVYCPCKVERAGPRIMFFGEVEELVLGYPCHMDGSEGERVERVLAFQEMLKKKIELPIHLYDERLSTMEAEEILRENGVPKDRQKEVLDQVAAQVILEDYLRNREEG